MLGPVRSFYSIFDALPDRRRVQGRRHSLVGVLVVVTLALINQQNSLRQIASWADGLNWQDRKRLPLRRNQVPSYSTIRRVLGSLDALILANAVQVWVEKVLAAYFPTSEWQGLAIDGKTLRGSRDTSDDSPALQVLNALVHELGAFVQSQSVTVGTNELGII